METGYIYALIDPRDGAVRYIGQTTGPLLKRRAEHYYSPTNQYTRKWIAELREAGVRPDIKALEEVAIDDLDSREFYWIVACRERGADLLNVAATNRPYQRRSPDDASTLRMTISFPPDVMDQIREYARGSDAHPPVKLRTAINYLLRLGLTKRDEWE
jgi:hypothetical protein